MTQAASNQNRYDLHILSFPNDKSLRETCRKLYGNEDPKLLAALSATPYQVGRTFARAELDEFKEFFVSLNIAHRFRSPQETIEFDGRKAIEKNPEAATNDSVLKSESSSFKKVRTPALIGLGLILIAGAAFYFLRPSSSKPTANSTGTFEAQLETYHGRIEQRRNSSLLWSAVENKMGLERRDSLRSFEASWAIIRYLNGSSIRLAANSFVIIGESEDPQEKDVELKDGSVQAKATSVPLNIKTSQGKLKISGGSSLQTEIRGDKLKVQVFEGKAELQHSSGPVVINALEEMQVEKTAPPVRSHFEMKIELVSPGPQDRIALAKNSFYFEWKPLAIAEEYTLEIAADEKFSRLLLAQKTSTPSVSLRYLDPGDLYWRVKSGDFVSEIRKLHVEQ